MPFCTQCGTKNDEEAFFCENCGTRLESTQKSFSPSTKIAYKSSVRLLSPGKKLSTSGALIGFVCFFLPWIKGCGVSLSGWNLAIGVSEFSKGSPMLFLIPICAIVILITIHKNLQGKADERTAEITILTASFVPLGIMVFLYLYIKAKSDIPVEIFTVWFLLNILAFASSAGGLFYDRVNHGSYDTH